MLTVALIGRPNVGKSTLFNRLTGMAHALVDDRPGVTRDRREGLGNIGPLEFTVFDTAGLEEAAEGSLQARMTGQSLRAMREADVALLIIDGRAGVTALDAQFASVARKEAKHVVLVVNKAEGGAAESTILDAYRLGLGEPVAISAAHGEGLAELYEALAPYEVNRESCLVNGDTNHESRITNPVLTIAVAGRPNAGKSTLINRLLGEERLLAGPEAGITRDAIAVPFEYKGYSMRLVDTAGMRRRARVDDALEKMAVQDARRAIQYAEVVVLMVDATAPLEKQDLTIASHIEEEGRGMVIALNKWDLVEERKEALAAIQYRLQAILPQVEGIPLVPVSGLTGEGLDILMKEALRIHRLWNTRVPTGEINRWLEDALSRHSPPMVNGRRIKIRYATQVKSRPPTLVLSSNMGEKDIPGHYLRYLAGDFREAFRLPGVPIRIKVKKPKNPYST